MAASAIPNPKVDASTEDVTKSSMALVKMCIRDRDETGSTWLAFPRMERLAGEYGLGSHPVVGKMQELLEELVRKAGSVYA